MKITPDIKFIGVNDHTIDLFEGQYVVPRGMAYNSYAIVDRQIAIMDSVDQRFGKEWMRSLKDTLGDRAPDFLVVQHMEPDHSASIDRFLAAYPQATVVASAQAFTMMEQFFGKSIAPRRKIVKDGDLLEVGRHNLRFVAAPMVHWPEVIVTYDATDKVLFSADGFGKFGANDVEDPEGWDCEARRYYIGIVGKFGAQTQALLKKAAVLDIQAICPLHGPVLTGETIAHAIEKYDIWSSYRVESPGVCIAYTSVYGHTRAAVELLKKEIARRNGPKVALSDLARDDMHETIEDAFRYGKLVLATTTYNGGIFPFMQTFIDHLVERGYCNREIAFVENGSWAPLAARKMRERLSGLKALTFVEPVVTLRSALNETSRRQIADLAARLS